MSDTLFFNKNKQKHYLMHILLTAKQLQLALKKFLMLSCINIIYKTTFY